VFGKGYLGVAAAQIPTEYLKILKISAEKDKKASGPNFHIGIATGSASQSADDLLGACERSCCTETPTTVA
jgi:hypothetical protein